MLIGITGPSCSGKSTIAKYLQTNFLTNCDILCQDDFYKEYVDCQELNGDINYDDIACFDFPQFKKALENLDETKINIVEGLYLIEPEIVNFFTGIVFLAVPFATASARRRERTNSYQRQPPNKDWKPEALDYFENVSWPTHQKHYASIYLDFSSKQSTDDVYSVDKSTRPIIYIDLDKCQSPKSICKVICDYFLK